MTRLIAFIRRLLDDMYGPEYLCGWTDMNAGPYASTWYEKTINGVRITLTGRDDMWCFGKTVWYVSINKTYIATIGGNKDSAMLQCHEIVRRSKCLES